MKFVADIHLHSYFSRATSKNLNLEYLSKWAQLKGVQVVGTGDIAHPGWLAEMKKKLEPAEPGLFRLKQEYARPIQNEVFRACRGTVRFMLAGEISNIYKKGGKVRKIHNVVFLPSFQAVETFQARLEKIGNIRSDGRPILGLDARDLLEIVLATDPEAHLIPAHIWTPWFSLLGSMSGFDSVEECFDDLTKYIFALETGLSSDPPMNWRLSILDKYTLVSNSDAHSPPKLAREANIFSTELSYPAIFQALKTGNPKQFGGTIEFFPEEGKYHFDGHRKCGTRWGPDTTHEHNGICTECGKSVTVGVMHRVDALADRNLGEKPPNWRPFKSLVPLPEILAEMYDVGVNTKRVRESYEALLSKLGPELSILQDIPLEELQILGGSLLSEGVSRMRSGQIQIAAGYDGEYGTIRLFDERDRAHYSSQLGFFDQQMRKAAQNDRTPRVADSPDCQKNRTLEIHEETSGNSDSNTEQGSKITRMADSGGREIFRELNSEQREAVQHTSGPLLIVAGPGTGKTRTLTHRLAYLVKVCHVPPREILAVTFTNKAAQEMSERMKALVGPEGTSAMNIKTFHALGLQILREESDKIGLHSNFSLCTEVERTSILMTVNPFLDHKQRHQYLAHISLAKNRLLSPDASKTAGEFSKIPNFVEIYQKYQSELQKNQILDYDDLIFLAALALKNYPEISTKYKNRFRWISVDEYQDINLGQYRLLKQLLNEDCNLCVIGDPDQAIYGFRGAQKEFFLKFHNDFLQVKTVKLSRNYRSSQLILDAARQIIAKNSSKIDRTKIWSDIVGQNKIETYSAPTDKAEAEFVVHEIEKMVGGTSYFSLDSGRVDGDGEQADRTFSDFVVLYRLGAQCRLLETAFKRSGIPYQTVGQTPFFERKPVKDLLNYLWFLRNPHSNYHTSNLLRTEKSGVGEAFLNRVEKIADDRQISIWEVIQDRGKWSRSGIARSTSFLRFVENLEKLISLKSASSVEQLIKVASKLFDPEKYSKDHGTSSESISQLILRAKLFGDRLMDFLESTVLQREPDDYDARAARVTLMTLHTVKGLEFPVVFVVGCEETLIPFERQGETIDLDEERRLFYVGITRAKQKVILTHAKRRRLFGTTVRNSPSRFLSDIERSLMEARKMQLTESTKETREHKQMRLF